MTDQNQSLSDERPATDLPAVTTDEDLADDLLWGAQAIADFVGIKKRKAMWKIERGLIPARKNGLDLVASKREIIEHFGKLPPCKKNGKAAAGEKPKGTKNRR